MEQNHLLHAEQKLYAKPTTHHAGNAYRRMTI